MSSNPCFHQQIIDDLLVWIDANLHSPINNQIVSERCGFSMWYMQRLFKKHTGLTLGTYIHQTKLDRSVIELMEGDDSVSAIAIKYGYESPQTFTRAISRRYGIPPGAIRKLSDSKKAIIRDRIENFSRATNHSVMPCPVT